MIIPLAIVLGMQVKSPAMQDFEELRRHYRDLLEKGDRYLLSKPPPDFRVDDTSSKAFESIAQKEKKTPKALKSWVLALVTAKPNFDRESKLIDKILGMKVTTADEEEFGLYWGRLIAEFADTFEARDKLPKVFDPFLAGSKSKVTTASLLLMKANTMSDILDIKWDVYNRLVEQYPGTLAAKGAREIILRKKHLQPGDVFPDFVSKDSKGEKFQLTKLRGKVVVLEFWANWCPSCQRTIPIMQGVEKTFDGQNVEFIGINSDGDASVVRELEAKYNITHRNLVDGSPAGPISISYNIMAWPSFIVIGKDGKVVFRSAGIDADGMTKAIAEALK